MGTNNPPPGDDPDDIGVVSTAEAMYQIFAGNSKAKFSLLLKASNSVPVDTIEAIPEIRQKHVDDLKEEKYIYEADSRYEITPKIGPVMSEIKTVRDKFDEQPPEHREPLSEFMYNTDWDEDLRIHFDTFIGSKIITRNPMSKYSTLIQTASAIKSVQQTIAVPEEIQYRLHDAQDLSPENVEFIYTNRAIEAVLTDDQLMAAAKENEQSGVSYQFLPKNGDTPAYNLTLLEIDEDLLEDVRAPTDWVANMDLSSWLVVIELIAPIARSKQVLIADMEAVRDWALNPDTGVYTKYEELATSDSWADPNPKAPLGEYLKV